MPATYLWRFRPVNGCRPAPFEHARGLQSLVYDCVNARDKTIANVLHGTNRAPYAVSPLHRGLDGIYTVRISAPSTQQSELLVEGAALKRCALDPQGGTLPLGKDLFEWTPSTSPAQQSEFEELWEKPYDSDVLSLYFQSSTATEEVKKNQRVATHFRKMNPSPQASWLFCSWLQRWNDSAPKPLQFRNGKEPLLDLLDGFVELISHKVMPSAGTTRLVIGPNKKPKLVPIMGFVGRVQFRLLTSKSQRITPLGRKLLVALARFSSYCGTGVFVMRGMGQTFFEEGFRDKSS